MNPDYALAARNFDNTSTSDKEIINEVRKDMKDDD